MYAFLRKRYERLLTQRIAQANEQEWNDLARLFVARFQELNGLPHDSLAGPSTFDRLEAAGYGVQGAQGSQGRARSGSA